MSNRRMTLILMMVIGGAMVLTPSSFSQSNAAHLAGSWKGAVTPTSPSGLTPFTSLITFTNDGAVVESRRLLVPASPLGPLLETTGHGAWQRVDEREFDVHFVFLLQGAVSGVDIGTDNVHLRLKLDSTDGILSGTFDSTIKDTFGNPVFSASGTYQAIPI
ncbi:MAG TPA: hypothetical protein VK776_17530 [Bryobacteraceae bacterium]|nr:hypothetical protein [Bryobacteraceae bacterium]